MKWDRKHKIISGFTPLKWIGVEYMTFYPFILIASLHPSQIHINHCEIHRCQIRDIGITLAIWEFCNECVLALYHRGFKWKSITSNSFEKEALMFEANLAYIDKRTNDFRERFKTKYE